MAETGVYALFIDIMGFAAAIEALDAAEHDDLDKALRSQSNWLELRPRAMNIAYSYTRFHDHLEECISVFRLALDSAMVFADSAYVVARDCLVLQEIAKSMMAFCYHWDIPLRAGIGHGNFARLVFSTASHPSGLLVADSPFLGSALVRAYRAERCPAKGFRIFLHPSVTSVEGPSWQFVELPQDERSDVSNRELNFLDDAGDYRLVRLREHLSEMRRSASTQRALLHYDASERALTRLHDVGEAAGWKYDW